VSGKPRQTLRHILRLALTALVSLTLLLPPATFTATAAGGERTLYMRHTHTGEVGRFTFKRNGQYDAKVLRELNVFLADWRTKEPTKMDPALFDLLWLVYREVGAKEPINIVSSYRSPKTNAMLASRSSAVADNSLHMKGKAIDFFIPGIGLAKLREAIMRHQVGGIGYYPTSGSPFVHADTGNVRAWPRMTRAQLKKVFPDGKTLHLPTDGRPLSSEGRAYAEREWKKCHSVPCGVFDGGSVTMLASLGEDAPVPEDRPRTLLDAFFGNNAAAAAAPAEVPAEIQLASLGGDPEQRVVPTFEIVAPLPVLRPSMVPGGVTADGAPIPALKSQRLVVATLYQPPTHDGASALAALDEAVPQARVLMTPPDSLVTAYAQDPEAERALRMIIERETTASLPAAAVAPEVVPPASALVQTASLGSVGGRDALKGMFDLTFNALQGAVAPEPVAIALADFAETKAADHSIVARAADLVAPELDHVNETLVHPVFMSAGHFAVLTEAEGYLDKQTELGPLTGRIGFERAPEVEPQYDRFIADAPLLVAAN
jgi:uncharacterized protein YcbK (DUF882 family)